MIWLTFRDPDHYEQSVAIVALAPFAINDPRALRRLAHRVYEGEDPIPDTGGPVVSMWDAVGAVKAARRVRLHDAKKREQYHPPTTHARARARGAR